MPKFQTAEMLINNNTNYLTQSSYTLSSLKGKGGRKNVET